MIVSPPLSNELNILLLLQLTAVFGKSNIAIPDIAFFIFLSETISKSIFPNCYGKFD